MKRGWRWWVVLPENVHVLIQVAKSLRMKYSPVLTIATIRLKLRKESEFLICGFRQTLLYNWLALGSSDVVKKCRVRSFCTFCTSQNFACHKLMIAWKTKSVSGYLIMYLNIQKFRWNCQCFITSIVRIRFVFQVRFILKQWISLEIS